jgi:glycosyltransferase involved in cell wall biosynthesis
MIPFNDFPRVLIITPQAFNHVTGTGVTFSNLFREWPKDLLACIHNDSVPTEDDVCDHYFCLGPDEIRKWGVFNWFVRKVGKQTSDAQAFNNASVQPAYKLGLLKRAAKYIRDFLFGIDSVPEAIIFSKELVAWIDKFQPDIIYSPLGDNTIMQFVDEASQLWDTKLVLHIMDDWRAVKYSSGVLSGPRRRQMNSLFTDLVMISDERMGICPLMCEAYEREFERPFLPFQNTIDTETWAKFSRTNIVPGKSFRILYAGSIFPFAQLESLEEICQAIGQMNEDGRAITLDIFSPRFMSNQYQDSLVVHKAITIKDPIPHGEGYFKALCSADLLLLPVNFDENTVRFIRYSMPTKVPEYLLSGVPIFVYGPANVAQIDYAVKSKWGYVETNRGVDNVIMGLRELSENMSLREKLNIRARKLAVENHDAGTVRKKFREALCNIF